MQNFKEDKPQPVRDEYEYVSDDGELKIDEFPIRRKKNAPKRDLSCELGGYEEGQTQPCRAILEWAGVRHGWLGLTSQSHRQLLSALVSVLLDKKEPLPIPVTKPKLDSALYKVSTLLEFLRLWPVCLLLGVQRGIFVPHPSLGVFVGRPGWAPECGYEPKAWNRRDKSWCRVWRVCRSM